ncbi:MAG: DegT/DnrJ/EryC1/StrS family aminotransferase [Gammaproteobacteria bacterium]
MTSTLTSLPPGPVLTWRALKRSSASDWPSVFELEQGRYFSSEAAALGAALDLFHLTPGTPVLVPSVLGPGLLPALRAREITALFYRLQEDFSPDLEHAERLLRFKPRAIIAGHPFGIARALDDTAAFARDHSLPFIEDCTEALWGQAHGRRDLPLPIGSQGRVCLAAPARHLPGWDVGILASAGGLDLPSPEPAPSAISLGRAAGALAGVLGQAIKPGRAAAEPEVSRNAPSREEVRSAPRGSESWYRALNHQHCIEQRRTHYHRLSLELAETGVFSPLLPKLPDGAVPMLYPVDSPERNRVLAILEDSGIPATNLAGRVPTELNIGVCALADRLRDHGLGLPCHQSLRPPRWTSRWPSC